MEIIYGDYLGPGPDRFSSVRRCPTPQEPVTSQSPRAARVSVVKAGGGWEMKGRPPMTDSVAHGDKAGTERGGAAPVLPLVRPAGPHRYSNVSARLRSPPRRFGSGHDVRYCTSRVPTRLTCSVCTEVHGRRHVWFWLSEVSGVVLSCCTFSCLTNFPDESFIT